MLSYQDTVRVSTELGRAHIRFEEALDCLREGELAQARMKLRGAVSRMLRMASLIEESAGEEDRYE